MFFLSRYAYAVLQTVQMYRVCIAAYDTYVHIK